MKYRKIIRIIILSTLGISLYQCNTEEIILHGDLAGLVADSETSQPIEAATIVLSETNDTVVTGSDGKFFFKNLSPTNFEIKVSNPAYETETKSVIVKSADITEISFSLTGVPRPEFSASWLDFGLDSTIKTFTISNIGKGNLNYSLIPYQKWITIEPSYGEATTETDVIMVRINRTGLTKNRLKEIIKVISFVGKNLQVDTISVLANGVMDHDQNYYGTVKIGTQTWLTENLRTTKYRDGKSIQEYDPRKIYTEPTAPVYCWYLNQKSTYGNIYGALYTFDVLETGDLCPAGWHVPSVDEVQTLDYYLGGPLTAGGSLKESGTAHWKNPDSGATNETGFTAIPGGHFQGLKDRGFNEVGEFGIFWTTTQIDYYKVWTWYFEWSSNKLYVDPERYGHNMGISVRCIKDL